MGGKSDSNQQIAKESKDSQNSPKPPSSNESQEYTYEWAIQNYVNFAENRVKSKSTTNILDDHKKCNGREYPPIAAKPVSTAKADHYLRSIDKNRAPEETKKAVAAVPKVDISGRRQLFEKMQTTEESKTIRNSPEIPGKKIKERLTSLEEHKKQSEPVPNPSKLYGFPSEPLVKNRLMNIESIASSQSQSKKSIEPITSISIKDRLNSLSKPDLNSTSSKAVVEPSVSIKDRLNSLQSSIVKETPKTNVEIPNSVNEKVAVFKEKEEKEYCDRSYSPDDVSKRQHYRHRSLDSLDIDQDNAPGSFERVQSLEDLDYRNYPPSTFSGDTDREDSGIHTADVSSSVSQADDYDHLDSNLLDNHQPPIQEESKNGYLTQQVRSSPVSPPLVEDMYKPSHLELSTSNCLPSIPEIATIPEIQTSVHSPSSSPVPNDSSDNSYLNDTQMTFNHPVANSTFVDSSPLVDLQAISDGPNLCSEPLERMVCPSQLCGVKIEVSSGYSSYFSSLI